MEKIVHKYKLGEEPDDFEYWLSKMPEERLTALETIRKNHITFFYNGLNPGFQRVYRAFKQQ